MTEGCALVSTEWLAANLRATNLRVVDGSWHMPQSNRDAKAEFAAAHVPGAVHFDIDEIADRSSALPHMLPSAVQFAAAVGALGISERDHVLVYDSVGVVSAARVWWTFRVFGHERVSVLDGGLRKWMAEGRPLQAGEAMPLPRRYVPHFRGELVRTLRQMQDNVGKPVEQVIDARSPGRFAGTEPEPRAGLRGGHIPGSINVPFQRMHNVDGTMAAPERLRQTFEEAGLDLQRPLVATCGSGVTAAILALGLHRVGRDDVAIYDGSWTEWGGLPESPAARAGKNQE
jgi:thiosulfate/3-mercaptopyruvate sulfurtransferase